jgi:dTDP-4-dehydrorhamnose reductase
MRILITGASGLIGTRVVEILGREYPFLILPDRIDLDITSKEQVTRFITDKKPDVIIHAAAFTDKSKAESERPVLRQGFGGQGECWKVNVEGTKNIVEASREVGAYVIFLSTASVFSGDGSHPGPFTEKDHTGNESSLSWYGWTKALAETYMSDGAIIRMSHPVRKSPIFNIPIQGKSAEYDIRIDFIQTILTLFDEKKLYPLFTDKRISITYIDDVAIAIRKLIEMKQTGIFHVVSYDQVTPYELALYAIEKARHVVPSLEKTTYDAFIKTQPQPKRFTKYNALLAVHSRRILDIPSRTWKEIVDLVYPGAGVSSDRMVLE